MHSPTSPAEAASHDSKRQRTEEKQPQGPSPAAHSPLASFHSLDTVTTTSLLHFLDWHDLVPLQHINTRLHALLHSPLSASPC